MSLAVSVSLNGWRVQGKLVEYLKQNMQINVISLNEEELVFDLIGVDASIANALRRILIAEVRCLLE